MATSSAHSRGISYRAAKEDCVRTGSPVVLQPGLCRGRYHQPGARVTPPRRPRV
jgi:hypothetical protein